MANFNIRPNCFMYFAYGSNLLKKRIHINNPSAEFIGIGRLDNHQLDFMRYTDHWRGTSATIVPTPKKYVWGAVWSVNLRDLSALDKQEGVDDKWYFAKTVTVINEDGYQVECRTYQQTVNPPAMEEWFLPEDRRPSITYLNCIIKGALQCELPADYIDQLKKIPHNGQEASPKMIAKLDMNPDSPNYFFYFAYGANMLKRRMFLRNPSAKFISIGRLDNYRMDFIRHSDYWGGPTITMVPTANAHIWGVIWQCHYEDLVSLDEMKSMSKRKYYVTSVEIVTPHQGTYMCRAYEQRVNPAPRGDRDPLPVERWPSVAYRRVLAAGAAEHRLPDHYVRWLEALPCSPGIGAFNMDEDLCRYARGVQCDCCHDCDAMKM